MSNPLDSQAVCQTANSLGFILGAATGLAVGENPIVFLAAMLFFGGLWGLVNYFCRAQLVEVPQTFDRNMALASGLGLVISTFAQITLLNALS